jgi:PAS domain S-box-containing protein
LNIEPEVLRRMSLPELIERVHPDDRENVRHDITEGECTGCGRMEYRFRGDDGKYRWLADHFTVRKNREGEPLSRHGIVRDISELRQALEKLKEANRHKDQFLTRIKSSPC